MRIRCGVLMVAVVAIGLLAHANVAWAGAVFTLLDSRSGTQEDAGFDRQICETPISTCEFSTALSSDLNPDRKDNCPSGFDCTCVPSCPECDDCAAQVCVPAPRPECTTACDCSPGLGCLNGRCIAFFAPVYCCDSDTCPANSQCQHRDGDFSRCEDDEPDDPMCRERVEKVTHAIGRVVDYFSYCRRTEDCVRVQTSTECIGTCGAFVNARRADEVSKIVDKLDQKICSDFNEDGCPTAITLCVLTRPECVDNRCVDRTGPLIQKEARTGR